MTTDELVLVLRDMADRVANGDSLEGSVEYLMPEPLADPGIDPDAHFAVRASYRIGNTQGQGGVRLVGRDDDEGGDGSPEAPPA